RRRTGVESSGLQPRRRPLAASGVVHKAAVREEPLPRPLPHGERGDLGRDGGFGAKQPTVRVSHPSPRGGGAGGGVPLLSTHRRKAKIRSPLPTPVGGKLLRRPYHAQLT